jgi:hypothetical protein
MPSQRNGNGFFQSQFFIRLTVLGHVLLSYLDRLLEAFLFFASTVFFTTSLTEAHLPSTQRVFKAFRRALIPFAALIGAFVGAIQVELLDPEGAFLDAFGLRGGPESMFDLGLGEIPSVDAPIECATDKRVTRGWDLACVGIHATLRKHSDRPLTHIAIVPRIDERLRRLQRSSAWHSLNVLVSRRDPVTFIDSMKGYWPASWSVTRQTPAAALRSSRRSSLLRALRDLPLNEIVVSSDGLTTLWAESPREAAAAFVKLSRPPPPLPPGSPDTYTCARTSSVVSGTEQTTLSANAACTQPSPSQTDLEADLLNSQQHKQQQSSGAKTVSPSGQISQTLPEVICASKTVFNSSKLSSLPSSVNLPGPDGHLLIGRAASLINLLTALPPINNEDDIAYFKRLCQSGGSLPSRWLLQHQQSLQPSSTFSEFSTDGGSSKPLSSSTIITSIAVPMVAVDYDADIFYVVQPSKPFDAAFQLEYSPKRREWVHKATGSAPAVLHVENNYAATRIWNLLQARDNSHCGELFCFPVYLFTTILVALALGVLLGIYWRRLLSKCSAGKRALNAESALNAAAVSAVRSMTTSAVEIFDLPSRQKTA